MQDNPRPLKTTELQLDEAVIRLAERTAERYGLTPRQLIETLLLECQDREPAPAAPPQPAPRRRSRGRVIEIAEARRRREERLA